MGDTEFLRLAAEEAELKRVKERLTLKHKNTSQWARRALRRGINVMDEGVTPHFMLQNSFFLYCLKKSQSKVHCIQQQETAGWALIVLRQRCLHYVTLLK